eukprot:scaffold168955_cov24-Tisochrysis_lutea.AAC.1
MSIWSKRSALVLGGGARVRAMRAWRRGRRAGGSEVPGAWRAARAALRHLRPSEEPPPQLVQGAALVGLVLEDAIRAPEMSKLVRLMKLPELELRAAAVRAAFDGRFLVWKQ